MSHYVQSGQVKDDAIDIARKIRAVALDSDGVLTDNTEYFGFYNKAIVKSRSHYDGQGISLLRACGIHVAIITGEKDEGASLIKYLVQRWNTLPSSKSYLNLNGWEPVALYTGVSGIKKAETLNSWLVGIGVNNDECAVMGDDLVDVQMLNVAGLRAAPAQAESVIRDMAHFVSKREGGSGAVRDFANFIFDVRGLNPLDYPTS